MFLSISSNIIPRKNFASTIMMRLGKTRVAKEELYGEKLPIQFWDINGDNIVISELLETKIDYRYYLIIKTEIKIRKIS